MGSIFSTIGTGFGMTAAAIAVCGCIAHLKPALSGEGEKDLREATLVGGIVGLSIAVLVIVLSAIMELT